jgi:catechol 2,3-dioxygenase-like lactoylglutathione lyase family enzyme
MLGGLNHLTLAVTDLERSIDFYTGLLGCRLAATWDAGAYLTLGELWICLSLDPARTVVVPQADYTHYAFSIAGQDLGAFRARLLREGVVEWRKNRSEGDSFYFLDPTATSSKPMSAPSPAGWPPAAASPTPACASTTETASGCRGSRITIGATSWTRHSSPNRSTTARLKQSGPP